MSRLSLLRHAIARAHLPQQHGITLAKILLKCDDQVVTTARPN